MSRELLKSCSKVPTAAQREALLSPATTKHELVFDTMHFAHKTNLDKGFEVQSVHIPGKPLALQCVAGNLLSVGLIALQMTHMNFQSRGKRLRDEAEHTFFPTSLQAEAAADTTRVYLPKSVAVFGMGGNVIANAFASLLSANTVIHVVEIEPAVVAMCTMQGLMPPGVVCHVCGIDEALDKQVVGPNGVELAIIDCFDPNEASMLHQEALLLRIRDNLFQKSSPSIAVINTHIRCTPESLEVLVRVYGEGCVFALTLFESEQTIFVVSNYKMGFKADSRLWNRVALARLERIVPLLVNEGKGEVGRGTGWLRASKSRTVKTTSGGSVVVFTME